MLAAQQIILPCVRFAARARLARAGSGRLTPIEQIALRSIAAGLTDITSLAGLLGIGERPTLDIVYDFWLKGYVVIDTTSGVVRLAGDAERVATAPEALESAENNIEVVPLIQDLASGVVLPNLGSRRREGPESAVAPAALNGLSLQGKTRREILDAVHLELQRRARRDEQPLVAREAWVEPDQLLTEASETASFVQERCYLPITADIKLDPDSGRMLFDIVEANGVPRSARLRVERCLTRMADTESKQLFFRRLREELDRDMVQVAGGPQRDALELLTRTTATLDETDPGMVAARANEVHELYEDAAHQVATIAEAQACLRLVVGYDRSEEEVRRLIRGARTQLVLVNPWIKAAALLDEIGGQPSWFDEIDKALQRGVQVILLWGISPQDELEDTVRHALFDLESRHQPRLLVPRNSSCVHAKIAVSDASEALVTSYNFLRPPTDRVSLELGVLVAGRAPDEAPAAIIGILEWVQRRYPEYHAANRILSSPHEMGAHEVAPPQPPQAPIPPDAVVQQREGNDPGPAIRYWARAWREVAQKLQRQASSCSEGADIVIDRQHREALWLGLRDASRRLVVTSDRLAVDVVNDRFAEAVAQRLELDVACRMVYRRAGAHDADDHPAVRLESLAAKRPEQYCLINELIHAKVLISDDEVVVGSFNFLSYGGDYEGPSAHDERAEISVRARSRSLSNSVVDALASKWPDAFGGLQTDEEASSPVSSRLDAPSKLQPLFAKLNPRNGGEAFLEWFGATDSPSEDLQSLARAGLPETDMAKAYAAFITVASDIASPDAVRARGWLAKWQWKKLDFVGAALLAPDENPGPDRLPGWLAKLGAAVQTNLGSAWEYALASEKRSNEETWAAALLVLPAMLEHGQFDSLDALDELAQVLPSVVGAWASAVRKYRDSVFQPLPMPTLRKMASKARLAKDALRAKNELSGALVSAETIGFRFPLGEHTFEVLKQPGRLLGELRRAFDQDDANGLALWLKRIDEAGQTAASLMDEASSEVEDMHNDRIGDPKRTSCLERLNRAIDAGREWSNLAAAATQDASTGRVIEECWVLRRSLRALQDDGLRLGELAAPAHAYALQRLAPLFNTEDT